MNREGFIVGVDASRSRSGGGAGHMRGLMSGADPRDAGIAHVHFWAFDSLLDSVEDQVWLTKHRVAATNRSIIHQLLWQYFELPKLLRASGCQVIFNTDAGAICPFTPSVTLSQDMLPFEPGEIQRYGWSKARLRLEILKRVQARSLARANLALFLTAHAHKTIGDRVGAFHASAVVPHGIDDSFRSVAANRRPWPTEGQIRCLYVSNAAPYKHQWHVVDAVSQLRADGENLSLRLVGGGKGTSQQRLQAAIAQHDANGEFVKQEPFVEHDSIPSYLGEADLFIFASSCENLPITLLEAMASGIPICCSNRGPMPEVLGEDGIYFDPEDPASIAGAMRIAIDNEAARQQAVSSALTRSDGFTWERLSRETWALLANVARQ
ncbi:MAG: glycosyltransferase family 4 protein [Hyphomicrobiaceae bacterium]